MASAIFVNVFLAVLGGAIMAGYSIAATETRKLLNPLVMSIATLVVLYNGYIAWLLWH